MLTQIELETLYAVKNAAKNMSNPTHEQKRYEIAKDCLAGMLGSPYHGLNDYKTCVTLAVECADELLKQLDERK